MNLLSTIQTIKSKGFTPELRSKFSDDELYVIESIVAEIDEHGSSDTLEALWTNDFKKKPASVEEFLTNDYYLGKVGSSLFSVWRKDLIHVLSPYNNISEWILKGSIGSGKTFAAVLGLVYKIYWLTCLVNPQKFYGLADNSPIVFGLFNIFKYLAQATSYKYLVTWLRDMSPYFKNFRDLADRKKGYESDKRILKLPNNVGIALGSSAIDALGQNIFGGILDEAEFGQFSSMASHEKSRVGELYHNVRTRMNSRFMQRGGLNPGLLCLVSSPQDTDNFLVKHVEDKGDNPTLFISSYALYEVKAHIYEDSDRFTVVVGDKLNQSYILENQPDGHVPREGSRSIKVPVEFREAFEADLDTHIRDICGVETYGKSLWLPRRDRLLQCLDKSIKRTHPFKQTEIQLGLEDEYQIADYLDIPAFLDKWERSQGLYRPRFYPFADRFVHVDLAKNRDCAGLAMCCIGEMLEIDRITSEGLSARVRDYTFFMDIVLRIRAAHGSEIDFSKIRAFIFFLLGVCSFKIKWVGYDSYQSTDSIQTFKKERIQSKELSVDRTPGPYRALRNIIMEGRYDCYEYAPMFEEMTKLEDYSLSDQKHKPIIDHPRGGAKDTSDAICGAVNGALISKGMKVTGTDAARIKDRAEAYHKHNAELAEQRMVELKPHDWLVPKKSSSNPLDKFFK